MVSSLTNDRHAYLVFFDLHLGGMFVSLETSDWFVSLWNRHSCSRYCNISSFAGIVARMSLRLRSVAFKRLKMPNRTVSSWLTFEPDSNMGLFLIMSHRSVTNFVVEQTTSRNLGRSVSYISLVMNWKSSFARVVSFKNCRTYSMHLFQNSLMKKTEGSWTITSFGMTAEPLAAASACGADRKCI